jgi:polyhydroxybutyrate depolymerase
LANDNSFPTSPATAAFWADLNSCSSEPIATEIEDVTAEDNSTVTLFTYTGCADQTEVLFYRVNDGGHTWPGGGSSSFGNINRDINASAKIIDK